MKDKKKVRYERKINMKLIANLFIIIGWIITAVLVIEPTYQLTVVGVSDSEAGGMALSVMVGVAISGIVLGIGYSIKKFID